MREFWGYLGGTVIKPRDTFSRVLDEPRKLAYGAAAVMFVGFLYTLTVIGLAMAEAEITASAWVAIPAQDYYFWEIFFALPVFWAGWILAAGIAQFTSRSFGASGNFEDTLAALGFAIALPSFVTWLPETIGMILFLSGTMTQEEWLEIIAQPGFWQIFASGYQLVALAWYLVLIPIAISVAQWLNWKQSIVVSLPTIVITGLFLFVFIR